MQLLRGTLKTPRVLKGFLGYRGAKTAETCTPKTPPPFRVGVLGYTLRARVFRVGAGRFLICFFEVHNRQNRHPGDWPFALFPSSDRSFVRAGMFADAKGN